MWYLACTVCSSEQGEQVRRSLELATALEVLSPFLAFVVIVWAWRGRATGWMTRKKP